MSNQNYNAAAVEMATQIGTNKIKELWTTWRSDRLKSMKSWGQFCDKTKFSFPKLTELHLRLKVTEYVFQFTKKITQSNVTFFQTNYIILFLVFCVYSILTNPLFLLALSAIGFLWLYLFKWRTEPIKIGNYTVTENQKTIGLAIITILVFYFWSVGNTIVYLIGLTATVVFLHALFFTPVEESDYDFNTGFTETQQV